MTREWWGMSRSRQKRTCAKIDRGVTVNKAEMKPDVANKARLVSLLRSFPENEPGKKKFVGGITE